jgi:hypothetical protein
MPSLEFVPLLEGVCECVCVCVCVCVCMYRANEEQVRKAQEANVHYSILTLLNYSILT